MRRLLAALTLGFLLIVPAGAVEPDEILKDPALEARARELSAGLRCMVCQNQSIDDSAAPLARDLRVLLRERLSAGDTDEEVTAYLVDRYGEFILLRPRFAAHTMVLWLGPALLFGMAALGLGIAARRRRVSEPEPLTADEEDRLQELISNK